MINAVLVDGVQVNNEFTFLSNVRDSVAAQTDLQSYSRGGRSGNALGTPFYRGFIMSLEWTIIATNPNQLIQQRDRLTRFFRLRPDKTQTQTRMLGFVMADGSVREVPAIFTLYSGSISPNDTTKTVIPVIIHTELEYLVSQMEFVDTISVLNLGGFSVPTPVPLDMSNDPFGEPTVITNQGNAEYYPCVKFYAPLDTITLINETTDKQIEYSDELTSSDVLELDFYERTAILNGTTNVLGDITGEWWYLDPGTNVIRLVVSSGDGHAEIKYRHAYRGF